MNELCGWAHAFHLRRGLCVLWGGLGCFGRPGGSVRARLQGCCREWGSTPACPPWPAVTQRGGRCLRPHSCPARAAELLERFCLCGVTGTSPRIPQITWQQGCGDKRLAGPSLPDPSPSSLVSPAAGLLLLTLPTPYELPQPWQSPPPPSAVASSWQRSRLLAASRSPRPSHR